MFRLCTVLALAAMAAASPCASAQWTVSKVTFRNGGTRSQTALEQAARIHAGQKATRADIEAAAQRLMDSGYFGDVKVDSKGAPGAMEVIFILMPEAGFKETLAGFDNFVWLTPEELQAVILKAAPLFNGRLPEAGNEGDVITAALQAALAAKGVPGTVIIASLQPSSAWPYMVTDFRVEPAPRIAAAHLSGVPPELANAEDAALGKLTFEPYNEGASGETTAAALLAPARNAGFLDARLERLQRSLNASGGVEVSAELVGGGVYHVSAVNMPQNAAQAPAKEALHPGEIASRERLLLMLAGMEVAYRKQGYMDVYIKSGEVLDTTPHMVSYTPVVVPGEIYHLHSITPSGLSPTAQAEFDKAWRMHAGDVYDADYVSHFIENNSSLRSLAAYKATFKAEADPGTRLVDLTIKFERSGIQVR